jgi:suppressor for copper-sensitivity B
MPSRLIKAALLVLVVALPAPSASAEDGATQWQTVAGARVRLIEGGAAQQAAGAATAPLPDAALEFEMEPDWHIYWRFPGETGIPTEADFSASEGIGSATLRFPAPVRYDDGYSTSIVYKDHVVLPIDLAGDASSGQPVLRASVRFGICSDICVPGEASLELPLTGSGDLSQRMKISAARLKLPVAQNDAAPRIASVTLDTSASAATPDILVEAELTGVEATTVDLFAEGAAGSYNAVPRLIEREGRTARFSLPSTGFKVEEDGTLHLHLVLVEGARAVTLETSLAGTGGAPR